MFDYGKRAGIMSAILVVLAIVPLLVVISLWPGAPEQVAMKVSESGEVLRWGSKFELLVAPAFCLVFCLAVYVNSRTQARKHAKSKAMAAQVCERYLRNGLVIGIVLNLVTAYMYYMALTGQGVGF